MAMASLRLIEKIAVFDKAQREQATPLSPLVGERWVACCAWGLEQSLMALLDRETLTLATRHDLDFVPLRWLGPERLLMTEQGTVGVWDTIENRPLWRADQGGGVYLWRDRLVTWASERTLEIRGVTGEVERSLEVEIPVVDGYAKPCGDLVVCQTPETGDPVYAVRLEDGRVQWSRDLLAEMNERRLESDPKTGAAITAGSLSDRFIATRDQTMAGCSLTDGALLWTADVLVPYYWPLVADGRIPVLNLGRFTVTDEATGVILVDRQHPQLESMYREKPGSILGDLVVFVSESGHVAAFDLRTGDLVSVQQHKRVAFWGTAVADGRVLASGTDGNLWVYEAA
jgi:hypothetical protein